MVYFNCSGEERKRKKPSVRAYRSDAVCPGRGSCGPSVPSADTCGFDFTHTGDVIRLPVVEPVTLQRSDAFTCQKKPAAEAADAAARLRCITDAELYAQINANYLI